MTINQNLFRFKNTRSKEILKTLGFTNPPFNPFEVAQAMGIKVDTSLDWDKVRNIKDGLLYEDKDGLVIWINPLMPKNRQNFTLAHELGHLVYDVLPNIDKDKTLNSFYYRNNNSGPEETRANNFAAALLMPIFAIANTLISIKEKDNNTTTDEFIDGLASIFEVSREAMIIRLKKLNVLNENYVYSYI
ncbi:ImmA/IrrE family metallo-endopeptidase [Campylobacter ureolyticus]|uniref:ImmA/IrrE family metallo-endopeptidase n=1 Tax=Campylobacter ureolyticus TaxID=827 RepID=A0A9Q4PV50_9BACT|nr:ImmA/IrrE family metallo-endopeptidase [Campylobacter ureolyticus]MCZ6102903.1 ImmA/IrrE family metallo-endopeptidase [Campylobacter ureolyticus]MCZ6159115.1 ImmA/IrrE family metallo-endopeptidase [Campylobacter ureolyticus]